MHEKAQVEAIHKSIRKTCEKIRAMTWQELVENGVELGCTMMLDALAFNALTGFAKASGRVLVKQCNALMERGASVTKQHAVEVAGFGKLILEDGAEATIKTVETLQKNPALIVEEGSIVRAAVKANDTVWDYIKRQIMEKVKYFFDCYFNQSYYFEDLDKLIQEFKSVENDDCKLQFIRELHQIIQTNHYKLASHIIKKFGSKSLNLMETEEVIKYIYNKLIDQPAYLDIKKFVKDCKVVFCPACCPNLEKIKKINLIEKATVIGKNMQVYICKPCKLVWLGEDIRSDNAQDYKKFMKSLGLKGLWKELTGVDTL